MRGVGQLPVRPARHGRRHGQGAGQAASAGLLRRQHGEGPEPVVLHRHLHPERDPHGRRVRDVRRSPASRRDPYSVTAVKVEGRGLPGFSTSRRPSRRCPRTSPTTSPTSCRTSIENGTGQNAKAPGRDGRGQDRYHRREQVGLVRRLHPAAVDLGGMFRENPADHRLLSMNGTAGKDSIHGGDIPTSVWTEYMLDALKGKNDPGFPDAVKIPKIQNEVGAPRRPRSRASRPARRRPRRPARRRARARRRRRPPRADVPASLRRQRRHRPRWRGRRSRLLADRLDVTRNRWCQG